MDGIPFSASASEHICNRFGVLNDLMNIRDSNGPNTPEYNRLFQDYVAGTNKFSDESESNKLNMVSALTFAHPDKPGETLFCSWHGKVNYSFPIRIHFKWPEDNVTPLYLVYIGRHIT
jgi:hypothetical protein